MIILPSRLNLSNLMLTSRYSRWSCLRYGQLLLSRNFRFVVLTQYLIIYVPTLLFYVMTAHTSIILLVFSSHVYKIFLETVDANVSLLDNIRSIFVQEDVNMLLSLKDDYRAFISNENLTSRWITISLCLFEINILIHRRLCLIFLLRQLLK